MKTPAYKLVDNYRHRALLPIRLTPSRYFLWVKVVIYTLFLNLGLIALFSYIRIVDLSVIALGVTINGLFVAQIYNIKQSRDSWSQISFNNGIWILENFSDKKCFFKMSGSLITWSQMVIIPLYCPSAKKTINLVLFSDSISSEDNARLRRWIQSECY